MGRHALEPNASAAFDALPFLDLDRQFAAVADESADEQPVAVDVGEVDSGLADGGEQVAAAFPAGQYLVGDSVDVEIDIFVGRPDSTGLLLLFPLDGR
jgi:hypothetical protein